MDKGMEPEFVPTEPGQTYPIYAPTYNYIRKETDLLVGLFNLINRLVDRETRNLSGSILLKLYISEFHTFYRLI